MKKLALSTNEPSNNERSYIEDISYRTRNLKPEYEMRVDLSHGLGLFPVHKKTGEVCDCKMEWDKNGEILSCPVCGLDGT